LSRKVKKTKIENSLAGNEERKIERKAGLRMGVGTVGRGQEKRGSRVLSKSQAKNNKKRQLVFGANIQP